MSLELYVYSAQPGPLSVADLASGHPDLDWSIAVVRSLAAPDPVDRPDGCLVLGWEKDGAMADRIGAAVAGRDARLLKQWVAEGRVAAVELDVESPFDPDPEDIAELRASGAPAPLVERVRTARHRHILRLGARWSDLSEEFHMVLWALVAAITEGVCEDPQSGDLFDEADDA